MVKLLLDTQVLLWALGDDPKLGLAAHSTIADTDNEVFVSPVAVWEIIIKQALGKLVAPNNLGAEIAIAGFSELPITFGHVERVRTLPRIHKDPFDRLLIAQAQVENLSLVTRDGEIPKYNVVTMKV